MSYQNPEVPQQTQMVVPTLEAIRSLGGSGRVSEIDSAVVKIINLSESQAAVLHGTGPRTEVAYRCAWARTYLKNMGLVNNSTRGVWTLTPKGESAQHDELRDLYLEFRQSKSSSAFRTDMVLTSSVNDPGEKEIEDSEKWRDNLIEILLQMSPAQFEKLSQRLPREAGFINVEVTGRPSDGGIDGVGVYRISLISFPVYFQCKRYRNNVPSNAVRDFRGAMSGRGEKGLLITTASFTAEAQKEATRDGAPPVDLIDGTSLCDLLKEYGIGVKSTPRTVEDIEIDDDFFINL